MSEAVSTSTNQSLLALYAQQIDHVAIAVHDLEAAIASYVQIGFVVTERLQAKGAQSSMSSAVLSAGPIRFVLLQGNDEHSQISQFIRDFGQGPQHIAIAVENCAEVCAKLEQEGIEFSTHLIEDDGLIQRFTTRCPNSGVMFEFIERREGHEGFSQGNVEGLFRELEDKNLY